MLILRQDFYFVAKKNITPLFTAWFIYSHCYYVFLDDYGKLFLDSVSFLLYPVHHNPRAITSLLLLGKCLTPEAHFHCTAGSGGKQHLTEYFLLTNWISRQEGQGEPCRQQKLNHWCTGSGSSLHSTGTSYYWLPKNTCSYLQLASWTLFISTSPYWTL